MSNFPSFTIKEMLEAGIHFGHKSMRWNPKMAPFVYGSRNGIHIIDLQKTAVLLNRAMKVAMETAKRRGAKILFVGTKRQATDSIKEAASKCGQFYVNHRWLGGMLTNWNTVSKSIKTLEEFEAILKTAAGEEESKYNKKELLDMDRKRQKLENVLGGIRTLGGKPDLIFVIDTNKEKIAIEEAKKLNIPVIAVIDTNSNPDSIDYVIPGNDDATKSIKFYCDIISEAILCGMEKFLSESGVDLGEVEVKPAIKKEKIEKVEIQEVSIKKSADKIDVEKSKKVEVKKIVEIKISKDTTPQKTAITISVDKKLETTPLKVSEKKKVTTKPKVETKQKTEKKIDTKTDTKPKNVTKSKVKE
jgi:small subunit ribosomal protein S2